MTEQDIETVIRNLIDSLGYAKSDLLRALSDSVVPDQVLCRDCKWWDGPFISGGFGMCDRLDEWRKSDDSSPPPISDNDAICDVYEYGCLVTGPLFGCIHGEREEK